LIEKAHNNETINNRKATITTDQINDNIITVLELATVEMTTAFKRP